MLASSLCQSITGTWPVLISQILPTQALRLCGCPHTCSLRLYHACVLPEHCTIGNDPLSPRNFSLESPPCLKGQPCLVFPYLILPLFSLFKFFCNPQLWVKLHNTIEESSYSLPSTWSPSGRLPSWFHIMTSCLSVSLFPTAGFRLLLTLNSFPTSPPTYIHELPLFCYLS